MKKIVKELELYTYKELKEDVKEKLYKKAEEYLNDNYIETFLYGDMVAVAAYLLKKYFGDKAEFKEIYYDLSYCQGSGAMIVFDLNYYGKDLEIKHSGLYSHKRSFTVEGDIDENRLDKLEEKIENMNGELENKGYDLIENYPTEDAIIEELETDIIGGTKYYLENGEFYGVEDSLKEASKGGKMICIV